MSKLHPIYAGDFDQRSIAVKKEHGPIKSNRDNGV